MMKILCALVAGVLIGQTADVVMSKRFMVVHSPEKTAVVLTSDDDGAGRLEVYDVNGDVAFSVCDGQVIAPCVIDLEQRIQVLEKLVGGKALVPAGPPVLTTATAPSGAAPAPVFVETFRLIDLSLERFHEGDESFFSGPLKGKHVVAFKVRNNGPAQAVDVSVAVRLIDRLGDPVVVKSVGFDVDTGTERPLLISLKPGEYQVLPLLLTREQNRAVDVGRLVAGPVP